MKAIVGVDAGRGYLPALQMLARFRFETIETTLAHFTTLSTWVASLPLEAGLEQMTIQDEAVQIMNKLGYETLAHAEREAHLLSFQPASVLRMNSVSEGLRTLTDETNADLIAVGAEEGSVWAPSVLGGVSRALAAGCRSSVLVTKAALKGEGALNIVLATDHSEESRRWIDRFLSWKSRGISNIHVITGYHLLDSEAQLLGKNLPSFEGKVEDWIEEHLSCLNRKVVDLLEKKGYSATSQVRAGTPNDVIRNAMEETNAHLLVIGAQGHGILDRLFVGSTSLHQVVSEPYPVLVVRGQQ